MFVIIYSTVKSKVKTCKNLRRRVKSFYYQTPNNIKMSKNNTGISNIHNNKTFCINVICMDCYIFVFKQRRLSGSGYECTDLLLN